MTSPTAPTRPIGVVDSHQFGTLVADVYENIPDLHYPLSVEAYSTMRRDGRLAAVLNGYTLQLRRAQWQLDGTGCRPEAVQLVADGLGLNIVGTDKPTGAKRRGVSWSEHLRAALGHLTFGHFGFELVAEVVDGRARLATLAERLPQSIAGIHSDPKTGALLGVDQSTIRGPRSSPQIPADRLVWYCHEREGAAWQGVSLLRPSYAAWLIKREMIRVAAISNRRWGAGVPVAEALPGTNPTPSQMAEAQQMMSAARAGDQAGAAVPPGFTGKILGLSGSVPDTLGFIEWLNREMAGSALMSHLDLGQGGNGGSRALGQAFLDSWTLALESIAENVADTATRQIAARIVEWNFGDDEPVPTVTVSGVGSRREVTAESLQLLLASGALAADPALEAWVRREYRLPERDETAPARTATRTRRADNDSEPDPEPEPAQVAAAAPPAEVDTARLQAEHAAAVAAAVEAWEEESGPLVEALVAATVAEITAGMLIGLAAATVPPAIVAALAASLSTRMLALASQAAAAAATEATRTVGAAVDGVLDGPTRGRITQTAEAIVGLVVAGYTSGTAGVAMRLVGPDVDPTTVGEAVRAHLTELSRAKDAGLVAGHMSSAMTAAQAEGRLAVLAQLPTGTRYRATEVNDRNRCGPCGKADGRTYPNLAAALVDYPTSVRYRDCAGGTRCRGLIYPIGRR